MDFFCLLGVKKSLEWNMWIVTFITHVRLTIARVRTTGATDALLIAH